MNAVLREQDLEDLAQSNDMQTLASVSFLHSREASERALALGMKHFLERE